MCGREQPGKDKFKNFPRRGRDGEKKVKFHPRRGRVGENFFGFLTQGILAPPRIAIHRKMRSRRKKRRGLVPRYHSNEQIKP